MDTKTTETKESGNSGAAGAADKKARQRKRRPEYILSGAKRRMDDLMVELQAFPEFHEELKALRKRILDRKREEEERLPF